MKLYLFFVCSLLVTVTTNAQMVVDYKVRSALNATDRTVMLDLLKNKMKNEYKSDFVFVVRHFKVANNVAWFMGDAAWKDPKRMILSADRDCCHIEALFKKIRGKWQIIESEAFSTDVWYEGIWDRYTVPKAIFN
jgi:hypothetical protein